MRLAVVKPQKLSHRVQLKILLTLFRMKAPDVVPVMTYRWPLFGKPFGECVHQAMRGSSEWSIGERELFAAFVSRLNQCLY